MTQQDIQQHYKQQWARFADRKDAPQHAYSSPVEDAIVLPMYRQMVEELRIRVDDGSVLDVGCGSGRWVHFFLKQFNPQRLMGIDVTEESVDLLRRWFPSTGVPMVDFAPADITDPGLDLGEQFDLINVANVLFHIPEQDLFANAMRNLTRHIKPGGHIVTTEYLPRASMRTNWMLVRSRYEFEQSVARADLRIVDIRAFSIFSNDPLGVDGPDNGQRALFNKVRGRFMMLASSCKDDASTRALVDLMVDVEQAMLSYCRERIAEMDLPSQKLVVLTHA
jgi:SAM-dependent methyltransferase